MTKLFYFMLVVCLIKLLTEDSLLIILMCFEVISMLVYFTLVMSNISFMAVESYIITLLTILVSESVLGLTFLVNLNRFCGVTHIKSFSTLKL